MQGEETEGTGPEIRPPEDVHPARPGPITRAQNYRREMEAMGWSGCRLARGFGLAARNVNRSLALLNLPVRVQEWVEAGKLSRSAAYAISRLEGAALLDAVAARVVAEGLSLVETLEVVRRAREVRSKRSRRGAAAGGLKGIIYPWLWLRSDMRITDESQGGIDNEALLHSIRRFARFVVAAVEQDADADIV